MTIAGYVWDDSIVPKALAGSWEKGTTPYTLRGFNKNRGSFSLPTTLLGSIYPGEIARWGISPGDFVEREMQRLSAPIVRINGLLAEEWTLRQSDYSDWIKIPTEPNQFLRLVAKPDPMIVLANALLPQSQGTSILIEGFRGSRKSDLLEAYLRALDPSYNIIYVFLERDNEFGRLLPNLPQGTEVWALPFSLQSQPQDVTSFVDYVFKVGQQRALAGQNVVILLDSAHVWAMAMNHTLGESGPAKSGGLSPSLEYVLRAKVSAMKQLVPSGDTNLNQKLGSLSMIGIFPLNEDDTGTKSLRTMLELTMHGFLATRGGEAIPCPILPLNPGPSLARRIEDIIGREKAQLVWNLKDAVKAREEKARADTQAEMGFRGNIPKDQLPIVLRRASDKLTPFYQRLLDQCRRLVDMGLTYQDIWPNWIEFLSGEYPPKPAEFGPIQSTVVLGPAQQAQIDADAKKGSASPNDPARPAQTAPVIPIKPTVSPEQAQKDLNYALGIAGEEKGRKQAQKELAGLP